MKVKSIALYRVGRSIGYVTIAGTDVAARVKPSAGALNTASQPSCPPAPARFTTTKRAPGSRFCTAGSTMRAMVSTPPPGG
jgi:hypothetical protein